MMLSARGYKQVVSLSAASLALSKTNLGFLVYDFISTYGPCKLQGTVSALNMHSGRNITTMGT